MEKEFLYGHEYKRTTEVIILAEYEAGRPYRVEL